MIQNANKYVIETKLSNIDVMNIFILTVVSLILHFWQIQFPNTVVFDEVHFGNFTNWYIKSEFFFDIHPPLGKLIMFFFANLAEYDGNLDFTIGQGLKYPNETYLSIRFVPAFFQSFVTPLIYLSVRFGSFGRSASFTSASLVCFDTSLLTEGRFILSDGLLHFFTSLHICVLMYTLQVRRYTTRFRIMTLFCGITLGFACSCKNTAWGLCALNGIIHIVELLTEYKVINLFFIGEALYRGVTLVFFGLLVYILSFVVHFIALPYNGQGTGYLTEELRNQLINKDDDDDFKVWSKRLSGLNLMFRAIKLSVIMHRSNMKITKFHPYQSRPIGWPLLTDIYVAFWSKDKRVVACIGNVFVYYMAFFGVIICAFSIKRRRYLYGLRFSVGWAVSYFPFFLIPRAMYLYHYHIPLLFGCCAYGAALDIWLNEFFQSYVSVFSVFFAITGFVLWSTYCFGTEPHDRYVVIWNDNWLYGDSYHRGLASGTSSINKFVSV